MSSDEVEEIIATSPVGWTRDEASLIASLALEYLEEEWERINKEGNNLSGNENALNLNSQNNSDNSRNPTTMTRAEIFIFNH